MSTSLEMANLEAKITEKVQNLDLKMALLEQKLDILTSNHLHHIQKDINWLKGILYAAVGGIILNLVTIIGILAKISFAIPQ